MVGESRVSTAELFFLPRLVNSDTHTPHPHTITMAKSFRYQICDLHGAVRKSKLRSSRVRRSRRKGGGVCAATKYPRCLRKKSKSGYAKCAARPKSRK